MLITQQKIYKQKTPSPKVTGRTKENTETSGDKEETQVRNYLEEEGRGSILD